MIVLTVIFVGFLSGWAGFVLGVRLALWAESTRRGARGTLPFDQQDLP